MKRQGQFIISLAATGWMGVAALAQTYVTPMMGGGQVSANMVHIDIYYDADANQLHAHVDDSYGIPELRALPAGDAFDPQARYAVLNGQAYNSQYGWNIGGFFTLPPGTAIWIEQTSCSPGLEVYQDWGRLGTYSNIFGTGGSPSLWKWSGVMVHNTYAIRHPCCNRLFAEYHIYFGDASTGSRLGFTHLGDTAVRLEWIAVTVEESVTFKFGAADPTNTAPLCFLNAGGWVTHSEAVLNLRYTNDGPRASQFEGSIPMLAVAATAANGGPATNHAALGSCLALQLVSLTGPPLSSLSFWEAGEAQPQFNLPSGEEAGTHCFRLSENQGAPGADPYGCIQGRQFAVNRPGLYCLGFRVVDTSTNGPNGGAIHTPSALYCIYLQAGLTVASVARQGSSMTAFFGGEPGQTFHLERTAALASTQAWQRVAGPLPGTNRIQSLTDLTAAGTHCFYRLCAQQP